MNIDLFRESSGSAEGTLQKRQASGQQPVALKRGSERIAGTVQPVAKRRKAEPERGKKRKAAEDCANEDIIHLVGDARETESAHRARHPAGRGWEKKCPRCEYYKHRYTWQQAARTQGASDRPLVGGETSWLAPKPPFLGGAWGLG